MLLEIKNLTVHYDKVLVLKGISMGVAEGSIVTNLGPNGAGKSTLLRTISGLKIPTDGEIWFRGKRIDLLSAIGIVQFGLVHCPEGRKLFNFMSVLENLRMGAYLRKDNNEIARDIELIYTKFPVLRMRAKQFAGTLSGGEQQMLAIARALMSKPKLLSLDEPSLGLAPLLVEEIGRTISDMKSIGVSVLLVEQNAKMALSAADYVYLLELGRIGLHGPPDQISKDDHIKKAYLGS
jgi:branched-chain amino acid transport system ATP-binding protein